MTIIHNNYNFESKLFNTENFNDDLIEGMIPIYPIYTQYIFLIEALLRQPHE